LARGKTKSRAAARKLKDKWKSKEWYKVTAPDYFNNAVIAETPADEPDKLKGRITEVTLQDITGDFSKMHIKLKFKIHDVAGQEAKTKFIGHDLTSDYVRRQTRRRRSKMDGVYDVLTKDGYKIRVKPMAIAEKRIQTSQQKEIRVIMENVIAGNAKSKLFHAFIKTMMDGTLASDISQKCKSIYPMRRIEIRRSQVLKEPSAEELSKAQELEAEALKKAEKAKKVTKKVAKSERPDEVKALTALPGVGAAKAQVLFDAGFKSVEEVQAASEEDLAKVIGPALAKKIKNP
jgi:small subunit ribosomal protein S3Ae